MTVDVREAPLAAVEVIEDLTESEASDRHRLELKVERAFVEAGKALAELRNRKLYRSTHHSFEDYCQDRFGYTRYSAYYKIAAACEVFDNLLTFSQQNSATGDKSSEDTVDESVINPPRKVLHLQMSSDKSGLSVFVIFLLSLVAHSQTVSYSVTIPL